MSRVTRAISLPALPFVLLALIFAVSPALGAAEPAGWYQQPSGTTSGIYSLSAVSTEVAWGTPGRTVDGGDHWAQINGQAIAGAIGAVDANTAWAAGGGAISKTTDGGATWTAQVEPPSSPHIMVMSYGICAVDANTCWVCGLFWYVDTYPYTSFGWVSRTVDGGLNWSSAYAGENGSICTGISAVDGNTAWTCGYYPTTKSPLIKTVDGGQTWVPQGPTGLAATFNGVSALDGHHAFAVASGSSPVHSYILRTTDGSTWDASDMGTDYILGGIDALGPNAAWAVGTGGRILKTSDGTNWTAQYSGTTADLASISAVDANVAWAGGAGGTLLHTVNGGVPPPLSVSSITPNTGVAGWTVNVTNLAGNGFQMGATVRLESGSTVVNATNVKVVSYTQITCDLALPASLGKYDVVEKNPDGQEVRLAMGFSVTNICGQGAGSVAVAFGLMMGMLFYIDNRRKRLLQFPEV